MTDALYPPAPALADTKFLEPSAQFKAKTYRMIFGIVLFILLYILLILFSIGLLVGGAAAAYFLVSIRIMWITIVIGLGLIMLGVLFFFFTIKFIFSKTVEEAPFQVEIERKDHPLLFEYIEKLSREVGTRFPKKIFLTPDVNASVSYNSSFWSMFLPVRKNLRIGLGLVNTLTLSEFKAVIAHEFGHFSQRSMKTGSYVYTMNKIIYNLAFQHDEYDRTLESWQSGGGWIGIFTSLTGLIVEFVRGLLRWAYGTLNVTYMALSREMEYHADLVACSAAGNYAMISTLRKIEAAGSAYDETLNEVGVLAAKKKKKVDDIYTYHSKVQAYLTKFNDDASKNIKSRLIIKDQWASHPSREEREANINKVNLEAPLFEQSAWVLFNNPEATRKEMTAKLYVEEKVNNYAVATLPDIDENITEEMKRVEISPTFNGVFNNRWISKFDFDKIIFTRTEKKFEDLFGADNREMITRYQVNAIDLETLKAIQAKNIRVEFFEFDTVRYQSSEVDDVIENLEKEVRDVPSRIQELDEEICRYYYQRAEEKGRTNEFSKAYKDLEASRVNQDAAMQFMERFTSINGEMVRRSEWRDDQVTALCRRVQELEKQVKTYMSELPEDSIIVYFANADDVKTYLSLKTLWNSSITQFNGEAYAKLHEYIVSCISVAGGSTWLATKAIYDEQLLLTPNEFVKGS